MVRVVDIGLPVQHMSVHSPDPDHLPQAKGAVISRSHSIAGRATRNSTSLRTHSNPEVIEMG